MAHYKELQALTGLNLFFGPSFGEVGGGFGNAILTRGDILAATVHPLPSVGEPRSVIESVVRIDGEVEVGTREGWLCFWVAGREVRVGPLSADQAEKLAEDLEYDAVR